MERHWSDNVADLFSGRIYNTLVSLSKRLKKLEKKMTKNQEIINNVAQELGTAADEFKAGIAALEEEIANGAEPEELDFSKLTQIADNLKGQADNLAPAPAGQTSTSVSSPDAADTGTVATPIDPTPLPPTPLAGGSGPTDAGVPIQASAPGVPNLDPPTTPVAEDATAEAGSGTSTEVPATSALPETDEGEVGGTVVPDGEPVPAMPVDETPKPAVDPVEDDTESGQSPNSNPTGEAPTGDSSSSSAAGSPVSTDTSEDEFDA